MEAEPKKRRRRFSEYERRQLLAAWRKSRKSAAVFAQQTGLPTSNLWRWKSAIKQSEAQQAPPGFVELRVGRQRALPRVSRAIETDELHVPQFDIEVPSGLRGRVYVGADADTLSQLLAALPGGGKC